MSSISPLFSLCATLLWNAHPKIMKNGPNSLNCIYCIKSLFKIKDIYESTDLTLKPFLMYHFNVDELKDNYNTFEMITFTTTDKQLVKTFIVYHILYQINILRRIILVDYFYKVAFEMIDTEGKTTKLYNTTCTDMFVSLIQKELKWFENNSDILHKLKIIVLRSKVPEKDMLNFWGYRRHERKTHTIFFIVWELHCFIISMLIMIVFFMYLPNILRGVEK